MSAASDQFFEWDETKRQKNIDTHGIDFIRAITIWDRDTLEVASPQTNHDEDRFIAIGTIGEAERIITVVFTWRKSQHNLVKRIISARRARKDEQKIYQKTFGHGS